MELSSIENYLLSNKLLDIIDSHIRKETVLDHIINCFYEGNNTDLPFDELTKFPYCVNSDELQIIINYFDKLKLSEGTGKYFTDLSNLNVVSIKTLGIIEEILISVGFLKEAVSIFRFTINRLTNPCVLHKFSKKLTNSIVWALAFSDIEENLSKISSIKNPYMCKSNKEVYSSLNNILALKGSNGDNILDDPFYRMIHKKSILVLGPAPIHFTEDINAYDVVVVINYKGSECYTDLVKHHPNIIGYYNFEAEGKIENQDKQMLEDLRYICFRKARYQYQNQEICDKHAREFKSLDGLLLFGQPYMLQNVLFDLLLQNPHQIKLSCFSLYATQSKYSEGYISEQGEKRRNLRAFGKHNIINQFFFVSFLKKHGYIKLDEFGNKLIECGLDQYIETICKYYVNKQRRGVK